MITEKDVNEQMTIEGIRDAVAEWCGGSRSFHKKNKGNPYYLSSYHKSLNLLETRDVDSVGAERAAEIEADAVGAGIEAYRLGVARDAIAVPYDPNTPEWRLYHYSAVFTWLREDAEAWSTDL